eukprot:TRINITY_DN5255_c0_g1_i1.p1 TRINITY_DN5255_c0_g1~~TRINITY_DN5255_c0_g1_i1.p1  ORF type:complete len:302 (-),score=42.78 TRINITY_DN5255_c0_g1_i1:147-1052(-)
MGCDGGSIPTRIELVKTKEPPKKADPNEVGRVKWTSCPISNEPLGDKVVSDELGNIFNKESIVQTLLQKKKIKGFKHIKHLKDVFELKLTPNPAYGKTEEFFKWLCPITLMAASPKHKFTALRSCGCVLSDRALKECPSSECLVCGKAFTKEDLIPLNRSEEEIEVLKQRMEEKKSKQKKSSSSNSTKTTNTSSAAGVNTNSNTTTTTTTSSAPTLSSNNETSSQAITSKPDGKGEKRKIGGLIDQSKKAKPEQKATQDKPKSDSQSLPSYVDKSVYASIFTSSLKEKKEETFLCRNISRV